MIWQVLKFLVSFIYIPTYICVCMCVLTYDFYTEYVALGVRGNKQKFQTCFVKSFFLPIDYILVLHYGFPVYIRIFWNVLNFKYLKIQYDLNYFKCFLFVASIHCFLFIPSSFLGSSTLFLPPLVFSNWTFIRFQFPFCLNVSIQTFLFLDDLKWLLWDLQYTFIIYLSPHSNNTIMLHGISLQSLVALLSHKL